MRYTAKAFIGNRRAFFSLALINRRDRSRRSRLVSVDSADAQDDQAAAGFRTRIHAGVQNCSPDRGLRPRACRATDGRTFSSAPKSMTLNAFPPEGELGGAARRGPGEGKPPWIGWRRGEELECRRGIDFKELAATSADNEIQARLRCTYQYWYHRA